MFHIEDVLQLKDIETIKLVVRRHAMTMLPGLFVSLLLIVIPFFLMFPLFAWGIVGMVVFLLAVLAGIIVAIRTVLLWDADVLIVSTIRLVDVDQKGIFSRFVTEIPLSSVQDVAWQRKGLIDTVFRIGTLNVQASNGGQKMMVTRVAHPGIIHELINDLRHATAPKRVDLSPERQERLRALSELLQELPEEMLDSIEKTIRQAGREDAVKQFLNKDESPSS